MALESNKLTPEKVQKLTGFLKVSKKNNIGAILPKQEKFMSSAWNVWEYMKRVGVRNIWVKIECMERLAGGTLDYRNITLGDLLKRNKAKLHQGNWTNIMDNTSLWKYSCKVCLNFLAKEIKITFTYVKFRQGIGIRQRINAHILDDRYW